jgi:hypothetical protein
VFLSGDSYVNDRSALQDGGIQVRTTNRIRRTPVAYDERAPSHLSSAARQAIRLPFRSSENVISNEDSASGFMLIFAMSRGRTWKHGTSIDMNETGQHTR